MAQRAGQILVQREILKHEADRMHLQVSRRGSPPRAADRTLRPVPLPERQLHRRRRVHQLRPVRLSNQPLGLREPGQERYGAESAPGAHHRWRHRLRQRRSRGLPHQGTKVKFDYAVVAADDIRKTINPTDAQLQDFFKQNQSRYATAIPEDPQDPVRRLRPRTTSPAASRRSPMPICRPTTTQHQAQFQVKEQVKVRHILIAVPAGRRCQDGRRSEVQGRRSPEADQGGR